MPTLTPAKIPPFVRGTEKKAFEQLYKAAADGVINKREATAFRAKYVDLFVSGNHPALREAVKSLTTWGVSSPWAPKARLTVDANLVLAPLVKRNDWL